MFFRALTSPLSLLAGVSRPDSGVRARRNRINVGVAAHRPALFDAPGTQPRLTLSRNARHQPVPLGQGRRSGESGSQTPPRHRSREDSSLSYNGGRHPLGSARMIGRSAASSPPRPNRRSPRNFPTPNVCVYRRSSGSLSAADSRAWRTSTMLSPWTPSGATPAGSSTA